MEPRLKELLDRLTELGPFPNMTASEGRELVDLVYADDKAAESPTPLGQVDLLVGWQPIGTAPKDGTPILLWHKIHKAAVTCKWNTGGWHTKGGELLEWLEATHLTSWPELAFTHWAKAIDGPIG